MEAHRQLEELVLDRVVKVAVDAAAGVVSVGAPRILRAHVRREAEQVGNAFARQGEAPDPGIVRRGAVEAVRGVFPPTLDSLMVVQIDKTIDAINAIGYPFRNNLGDTEHINTATEACADLTTGLGVVKSKFTN